MTCAAKDPSSLLQCQRPGNGPQTNHENHSSYDYRTNGFVDWLNSDYVKPAPALATKQQREGRVKKKLRDMVTRVQKEEAHKPSFYPTENDMRGRTALYLMKYEGEWIGLDELEMKTVGGKGALRSIQELTHHYGWNIAQEMGENGLPAQVMLIKQS